jgi:hypothetical protein
MGGKVAKKLGDGLMALFGYPLTQENDLERTIRAALSIQRALAELNCKNEGTGKPVLVTRITSSPEFSGCLDGALVRDLSVCRGSGRVIVRCTVSSTRDLGGLCRPAETVPLRKPLGCGTDN